MMAEAMPATPSIEVGDLLSRADAGEPLLLLDVRNDEEFESTWDLWQSRIQTSVARYHHRIRARHF